MSINISLVFGSILIKMKKKRSLRILKRNVIIYNLIKHFTNTIFLKILIFVLISTNGLILKMHPFVNHKF